MKKREAALRSGATEKYLIKGKTAITLYYEVAWHEKQVAGWFTVDVGSGIEMHNGTRFRYPHLQDADAMVFKLRDKTPVDLAMQIFDITVTPDDD